MNWDYIADGADPRGVEYAATRRAARGARETQQNTADLLELELARATGDSAEVAQRIRARRQAQASRRSWWRRLDTAAAVAVIVWLGYCFAPHNSTTPDGGVAPVSRGSAPQNIAAQDMPAYVRLTPQQAKARARLTLLSPNTRCIVFGGNGHPLDPATVEEDGLTVGEIEQGCRERPFHAKELKAEGLSESDAL